MPEALTAILGTTGTALLALWLALVAFAALLAWLID